MKSKTSFSNLTTFKKDITRFAPVWALYLIGMILVLMESSFYNQYDRFAYNFLTELFGSFGVVNLIYAGVIAVMLFGDLYNTRMCYSLHTQPARRETLLLSHLGAGFLFSLVPNMVAALYFMTQLQDYWFLSLYWLLAVELQFLFYYGVAVVSALLTGNRFAMLLVYAGFNFVSMLAYWVVNTIYLPYMTGVVLDLSLFSWFCPTVQLVDSFEFLAFETEVIGTNLYGDIEYIYRFMGLSDGWGYLAILACVGVAAMGLAMLLYRMRHLECAGDFVAFSKLKNVACVIMTICVTGVFAFVGAEMIGDSSMILWICVGLIVGFFGSLMLLERRVKVFRVKTFLGLGALAVVLVASFLAVSFDVFGIEHYIPQAEKVESVTITNYRPSGSDFNFDEIYLGNRYQVKLTEDTDIAQIITAHKDVLDRLEENTYGKDTHRISFIYKLESGRTVIRSYIAPASGTNYEIVSKYFYTPQTILGYTDWESYVQNVEFMYMKGVEIPPEMYRTVLEALKADCEKGCIISRDSTEAELNLELQTRNKDGQYIYRTLFVLPGAENTLALLKLPELQLGYTDPAAAAKGMQCMTVEGKEGFEITGNDQVALLEALLQDCKNGTLEMGYHQDGEYQVSYEFVSESGTWCYRYLYVSEKAENTYNWIREYINNRK